jgi:hypothetical protein
MKETARAIEVAVGERKIDYLVGRGWDARADEV